MTKRDFAYHLINYDSSILMLSIHTPIFFLEKFLCMGIEQLSLLFPRCQLKNNSIFKIGLSKENAGSI